MEKEITELYVRQCLSHNLKSLRKSSDVSQMKLADYVNISPSYINELENDIKSASLETIAMFCNYFQIEPFELFLPKIPPKIEKIYVDRLRKYVVKQIESFPYTANEPEEEE